MPTNIKHIRARDKAYKTLKSIGEPSRVIKIIEIGNINSFSKQLSGVLRRDSRFKSLRTKNGLRLWFLTEWDQSLPED